MRHSSFKSNIQIIEIDNAKDIDIVMPLFNFIEYSDNYSKIFGPLCRYYKIKVTWNISADGNAKDVEIRVPLNYLSNFWTTLEMALISCEINLI